MVNVDDEYARQLREFEQKGEALVREDIVLERYGEKKLRRAEEWLRKLSQAREEELLRRSEASQSEQVDIARSARDASWASAKAADEAVAEARRANKHANTANIIAMSALAGAAIAIGVSILGFFIGGN